MQKDIHSLSLSRRQMLRVLGLASGATLFEACAPAATPISPIAASKPSSQPAAVQPTTAAPAVQPSAAAAAKPADGAISDAAWNALVEGARQEGKFNIATYAGSGYRKVVDAFGAAFPGIAIEQSQFQSSSRDFAPRALQELKAGLYSWDVAIMPPQEMLRQIRPAGGIEPVRPLIVRADVVNDAAWINGFEAGFHDIEKRWGYALTVSVSQSVWINPEQVKDGEITRVQDLLDPRWKGKIIASDPRTRGSGFSAATVMRLKTGDDDIIRKLYKDQEVLLATDPRVSTEDMVRGRHVISIGAVDKHVLSDFRAQGLGQNLKYIPMADIDYQSSSFNAVYFMKNAAHPKAAQVFINWALSKEAGALWAENLEDNSRRTDVPVFDPSIALKPGEKYLVSQDEPFLEDVEKTQKLANEVLN
ncbi:MAG TPA: extracellular solute-binding protein [Chloroflexota bacterium]|nr:extracellular solute-binding protein [Chloroflexota bacterium]